MRRNKRVHGQRQWTSGVLGFDPDVGRPIEREAGFADERDQGRRREILGAAAQSIEHHFRRQYGDAAGLEHPKHLLERPQLVLEPPEVLDRGQAEHEIEGAGLRSQCQAIHAPHLEMVLAVIERRVLGRVRQDVGLALAANPGALVEISRNDAGNPVGEEVHQLLVPAPDAERRRGGREPARTRHRRYRAWLNSPDFAVKHLRVVRKAKVGVAPPRVGGVTNPADLVERQIGGVERPGRLRRDQIAVEGLQDRAIKRIGPRGSTRSFSDTWTPHYAILTAVIRHDREEAAPSGVTRWLSTALLMGLAVWTWRFARDPLGIAVMDFDLHLPNLVFHEAGHVIFAPLGRFMSVLGGSLLQVLIPVIAAVSFIRQSQPFSAAVCAWSTGQNLVDLAPYIADARALRLVLLGGRTGAEVEGHDFECFLTTLGVTHLDRAIGLWAHYAGILLIVASIAFAAWTLYRPRQPRPALPFTGEDSGVSRDRNPLPHSQRHPVPAGQRPSQRRLGRLVQGHGRRTDFRQRQAPVRPAGYALCAGPLGHPADLPGDGCRRQGRRHQARHVGRQPAGLPGILLQVALESEELDHDYLWRCIKCLPERGRIGIFNRSTTKRPWSCACTRSILAGQKLPPSNVSPKRIWKERFEDIGDFERYLSRARAWCAQVLPARLEGGTATALPRAARRSRQALEILAGRRRRARAIRGYMLAYEDTIRRTSTPWAPWRVIPGRSQVVHAPGRGRRHRQHHRDRSIRGSRRPIPR